jgi:hypothetical protein
MCLYDFIGTSYSLKYRSHQGRIQQGFSRRVLVRAPFKNFFPDQMPFPAIWALNYELQFDFKKGKTLEIMLYFLI